MNNSRVETIDVFRGVAILLVVLFHFTARLPGHALNITDGAPPQVYFGWVGVYFFFIVSGYCIFMTLERSATVGVFLARRLSRIYPAFAAAVLLLFAFGLVAHVPSVPEAKFHVIEPSLIDVAMNLVFVGEIGEWVNGSFWSIAVEMKFYLLVAIMAVMFGDRMQLTRVFSWLAIVMAPIWAVSTLFSWIGSGAVTPQSMLKFLAIAPYLTFFAVGILGRQMQTGASGLRRLLVINLVLSTAVVWIEAYSPGQYGGVVTATVCALVYLGLALLFVYFSSGGTIPHVPGVSTALAKIGLLSFSWYLVHENIGMSFLATFNLYMPAWASLALTITSTLCIGVVFANLFEWRFRKAVEKAAMAALDWLGRRVSRLSALRTTSASLPAE